jgi:hypothetical protein
MVDDSDGDPRWNASQIGGLVGELCRHCEVRPVFWPRPIWSRAYSTHVRRILDRTGLPPVFDVEHHATGRQDRTRLAHTIESAMATGSAHEQDYIVSTHPWHPEATPKRLVGIGERLEVQAYSTGTAVEKVGDRGRPGEMQRWAFSRGLAAANEPPDLALACYGQTALSPAPEQGFHMLVALREALSLGVRTVSYWSLKHVLRNSYALPFLRDSMRSILAESRCGR